MKDVMTPSNKDILNPTQFFTIIRKVKYLDEAIRDLEMISDRFSQSDREWMLIRLDKLKAKSIRDIIIVLNKKRFSSTLRSSAYIKDFKFLERYLYDSSKIFEKNANKTDDKYHISYEEFAKKINLIRIDIFELMMDIVDNKSDHWSSIAALNDQF